MSCSNAVISSRETDEAAPASPLGEDVADGALGVVADDADPDFQVDQPVADQRVGELAAFAGELLELGQHPAVHRRLVQGAGRPLVPEAGAGERPAAVLLADPVGGRHPDVVEEHLGEQVPAGEVTQRPDLHAGRVRVDDQVGDALLPAFPGSGPDQGEEDVGVAGVRRPDLLAVDDVLVAVAAGGGAQAGQVRACFRFRVALGPHRVAAEHRGQPAALLLRGAVLDDRGGGDVQAGAERARYPGAGELLLVDHLAGERQLHAAELGAASRDRRSRCRTGWPATPWSRRPARAGLSAGAPGDAR